MKIDMSRVPFPELVGAMYSFSYFSSVEAPPEESPFYRILSSLVLVGLFVWGVRRSLRNISYPKQFACATCLFFIGFVLLQVFFSGDVVRLLVVIAVVAYAIFYYRASDGLRPKEDEIAG